MSISPSWNPRFAAKLLCHLASSRGKGRADRELELEGVGLHATRAGLGFHQAWAQTWPSNPPNEVLTCSAHPPCRTRSVREAPSLSGDLPASARSWKQGSGRTMRKNCTCAEGAARTSSLRLLPGIHPSQDSVTHKSPSPSP